VWYRDARRKADTVMGKDDPRVVKFLVLLEQLKGNVGDDPTEVQERAARDQDFAELCDRLGWLAISISASERRESRLFTQPVDPIFINAWRDYEERWQDPVDIFAFDGLQFSDGSQTEHDNRAKSEIAWEGADYNGRSQLQAISLAIRYANNQVDNDDGSFEEDFIWDIKEAASAWENLTTSMGVDLQGVFRRRQLTPFVLVPRHVAQHYGSSERVGLMTNLHQAQTAFVFGVPLAALALMRSVLETTLRDHYFVGGQDLEKMIDNSAGKLPRRVSVHNLHKIRKLANSVLHVEDIKQFYLVNEKPMIDYLHTLRRLIEGAPATR
jgi:hypothetical protein